MDDRPSQSAHAQAGSSRIAQRVQQVLEHADLGRMRVSLLAVDLDRRRTLLSRSPRRPMMPASNMKLVTTAAALALLGPDFAFRTELSLTPASAWSPAPDGPLLVIRGDGDPAFGDLELLAEHGLSFEAIANVWVEAAVKASRERGLRRFAGLVLDENIFDRVYTHPSWPADQLDRWYCAPIAGLNLNTNCLSLIPSPSRPGQPPRVELRPEPGFLQRINKAITGNRDAFWAHFSDRGRSLTFRGEIKQAEYGAIQVPIPDPPQFLGRLIRHRLEAAGLEVGWVGRMPQGHRAPKGQPLHRVRSHLAMVIARCNKESQNMYAEGLLKRIGHQVSGRPGSWANGSEAVETWLREGLPGVDASGLRIADGSGLSRDNRLSAELLVGLLSRMHADGRLYRLFLPSLSVAGQDGTLHDRMSRLEGRVYAKSGYIRDVSALSGYLVHPRREGADPSNPAENRTIAFSLLFNDFPQGMSNRRLKALQNEIVGVIDEAMAGALQEGDRLGG
jgi:D-alanyl-D-alanine carboxypeptidase/D-alanyl-D-alanine-endopeptidase (penicillin-binding protein 4)